MRQRLVDIHSIPFNKNKNIKKSFFKFKAFLKIDFGILSMRLVDVFFFFAQLWIRWGFLLVFFINDIHK